MNIRNRIKNWIVNLICDTYPTIPKIDYSEVEKMLDEKLSEYNMNGACYHCYKAIIGHRAGYYKNFEGKLFCSHKCIDENNDK